jgi:diadenosine tetraphosphate (Ap4A) HIT family hydrolase
MDKTVYKIGEMIIDNKQIFWKMKYCFALIPIVQHLDGRNSFLIKDILLAPKRQVPDFTQLEPVEVFDITLAIKFLCRSIESFYSCSSTTIHIQNSTADGPLKHLIIHIIPRKPNDFKNNDMIYPLLKNYPEELHKQYNEKMNFYINAYANKIL